MMLRRLLLLGLLLLPSLGGVAGTLDAKLFFSEPSITAAQLSPTGKTVAALSGRGDDQQLILVDVESGRRQVLLKTGELAPGEATIRDVVWLDGRHIAIQFAEIRKGVRDLLDTRRRQELLIVALPKTREEKSKLLSVRTPGWLAAPLPQQNNFLYAKSGVYSKLYRITPDVLSPRDAPLGKLMLKDGGQFVAEREVASVEGYATRWFIDAEGEPEAALHFHDRKLFLSRFNGEDGAESLYQWTQEQLEAESEGEDGARQRLLLPVARAAGATAFYCLDFHEDEERSVYRVDFATGEEELVYEADAFKIFDLVIDDADRLVAVQVVDNGDIHLQYLDGKPRSSADSRHDPDPTLTTIVGEDLPGKRALVYHERHFQPGYFEVLDRDSGDRHFVGSLFPWLHDQLRGELIEDVIKVEGLDIPYLLSLPTGAGPYPLLVMPHGGPIGIFDHRYFDGVTQFFVSNGYAVLRVNFRGSSGYSAELKEAGRRQWGALMLTDIHRSAVAVSQRVEIDAQRICIVGMSYGGYAAAMLLIQHPDFYRCGASIAAVTDLNLFLRKPGLSERTTAWLRAQVGDPVTEYKRLKHQSPVYRAAELRRPLLVAHGAKDTVVDVEHAHRLALMLGKYGKDYHLEIYPEGEHSFNDPGFAIALFRQVEDFVRRKLTQGADLHRGG